MIPVLHGVFLAFLGLALLWNLIASAPAGEARRPLDRKLFIPLQIVLTIVLVRDRWTVDALSWLGSPAVAGLFPLAFILALCQNVSAIRARGPRLTDVPIVVYNVGIGACVTVSAVTLLGGHTGPAWDVLLYDYSVLQRLLGSFLAHVSTLSWHPPILLRRSTPETLPGLAVALLPASLCAFAVLMLVAFRSGAEEVVRSFQLEPRIGSLSGALHAGVWQRPRAGARPDVARPPGDFAAWVLPADDDGSDLRPPQRPLVLELRAPRGWRWSVPARDVVEQTFLDAAGRLAERLQPTILIPVPEPDGEAALFFGANMGPVQWRAFYERVAARLAEVSPQTRLAVRLHQTQERSRLLLGALVAEPAVVSIVGPRLAPGGIAGGGAQAAGDILDRWSSWMAELPATTELWVLAAGCSPLAYGTTAQARFVEGCIARTGADTTIAGLLLDGWEDRGHTQGLLGPGGLRRPAGDIATRLLGPR